MKIYYGDINTKIDVTAICLYKLCNNNIITIPSGDSNRTYYFSDPLYGVLKKIYVISNKNVTECNSNCLIKINLIDNVITLKDNNDTTTDVKISIIHSKLKIKYGNFNEELPEQKMAVKYLKGHEKVLEIGGNIGRNSLIIASILENNNFVTLECDSNIYNQLVENRDINNFTFNVENSALSNRRLIQQGWDTIPSDILLEGFKWVNTITLDNLNAKYNIEFDTLVLDCEGAFYYILTDMPEILNNINLIIMENDYHDINKKQYIDSVLISNKFYREYSESGGWGPCYSNFFEVWKKL
jgi:FkbM family methyltransferase